MLSLTDLKLHYDKNDVLSNITLKYDGKRISIVALRIDQPDNFLKIGYMFYDPIRNFFAKGQTFWTDLHDPQYDQMILNNQLSSKRLFRMLRSLAQQDIFGISKTELFSFFQGIDLILKDEDRFKQNSLHILQNITDSDIKLCETSLMNDNDQEQPKVLDTIDIDIRISPVGDHVLTCCYSPIVAINVCSTYSLVITANDKIYRWNPDVRPELYKYINSRSVTISKMDICDILKGLGPKVISYYPNLEYANSFACCYNDVSINLNGKAYVTDELISYLKQISSTEFAIITNNGTVYELAFDNDGEEEFFINMFKTYLNDNFKDIDHNSTIGGQYMMRFIYSFLNKQLQYTGLLTNE